jgi:hypothetical protein
VSSTNEDTAAVGTAGGIGYSANNAIEGQVQYPLSIYTLCIPNYTSYHIEVAILECCIRCCRDVTVAMFTH